MDIIHICDLEVFYRVGVPEEERARPQRLLLDLQMRLNFAPAAEADDLGKTINYFAVTQRLLKFGEKREWKLIETLAQNIAQVILAEFGASSVRVEVKKFIIPEARHISVVVER
jgi:FolB domain-containing protein